MSASDPKRTSPASNCPASVYALSRNIAPVLVQDDTGGLTIRTHHERDLGIGDLEE